MDNSISKIYRQIQSLLLYQDLFSDGVGQAFGRLLQALEQAEPAAILTAYGHWFQTLADRNQGWQTYLFERLLSAENPFSLQVQTQALEVLPPPLQIAAAHDLRLLQQVFDCRCDRLQQWVGDRVAAGPIGWLDDWPLDETAANSPKSAATGQLRQRLAHLTDWADALPELAAFYRRFGTGPLAEFAAFRWSSGALQGIAAPDPVQIADLVGYESQRDLLIQNTQALLSDLPALNVLLYGSRGTGKSSLVKALLHRFGDDGLRLIEVAKADLIDLPQILERLRSAAQKFIIFVDDLSFEEDEAAFKALKVVLEGSLMARPRNVAVYATSNRRHLIREFFADRPRPQDSDEIHSWDTVQEKLSFSDRFGLTLTFEPADQPKYLQMVAHLAQQAGIDLAPADLEFRALQWATRHNGRSGRSARQFVDFLTAERGLNG
jgi:uncharacterized protein